MNRKHNGFCRSGSMLLEFTIYIAISSFIMFLAFTMISQQVRGLLATMYQSSMDMQTLVGLEQCITELRQSPVNPEAWVNRSPTALSWRIDTQYVGIEYTQGTLFKCSGSCTSAGLCSFSTKMPVISALDDCYFVLHMSKDRLSTQAASCCVTSQKHQCIRTVRLTNGA